HLVHLRELGLQGIQVHHLGLLVFELVPERDFLLLPGCKRVLLAADVEVPAEEQDHDDDDRDEEALDRCGPAANVVAIETAQVIEEFHGLAPPLLVDAAGAGTTGSATLGTGADEAGSTAGAEAGAACGGATGAVTGAATVDAGLTAVLATAAAGAALSDVAGMAALEPDAGPEPSSSLFGVPSFTTNSNSYGALESEWTFSVLTSVAGPIHGDASMLRMYSATVAFDCATPSSVSVSVSPFSTSFKPVRRAPAGMVSTIWSNRCTICERLDCNFSTMRLRSSRCFLTFCRLLISVILESSWVIWPCR